MNDFAYHRAASLAELWDLVGSADGQTLLLAGGTDVVPALKRGIQWPVSVVDVKRIPALHGITRTAGGGLSLGAALTLHTVARSPVVIGNWPVLAEVAGTVASYQIRNRGTLGGNLCLDTRCSYFDQSAYWRQEYPDCRKLGGGSCYVVPKGNGCHALSSSDLAPLLAAVGAQAEVASPRGDRIMPVEDLWAGDGLRATTLGPGDVLTRVLLPPHEHVRVAYRRFATRETVDFPMVSVAAAEGPEGVRIAVGHVGPRPLRAAGGEAALAVFLAGGAGSPAEIGDIVAGELTLTSSVRGSVFYKKRVLRTLVAETTAAIAAVAPGREV